MTARAFFDRYQQLTSIEQKKDTLIEVSSQHGLCPTPGPTRVNARPIY
jgi:hypothetical protein